MKRIFTLAILSLLISYNLSAQYNTPQNYNWYFGTKSALSFSTGSPVVITNSAMDQEEGCASVSNPTTGALQFYTDGRKIWNSSNAVMLGGASVIPYSTYSTTMGALIVPSLANTNQYYLFSMEEAEDYLTGDAGAMRLYCCTIDMTLAGGLGGVVPGSTGLFSSPVAEKLIAIPGNNCNIWLVTHGRDNNKFIVYEITSTGINMTPVVSSVGTFTGYFSYDIGVIKVSPDRTKIGLVNWNDGNATGTYASTLNGTELYDFDANTGIVSNCRVLESVNEGYGCEFSADNTKLYVNEVLPTSSASYGTTRIVQYTVTGATAAAIIATKYVAATNPNETDADMKLAINGKIYFSTLTSLPPFYLSSINTPNVAGAGCGYANNTVTLSPGTTRWVNEGMPNVVQNTVAGSSITGTPTLCIGGTTTLSNATPGGTWSSVTTTVATIGSTDGVVSGVSAGTTTISYTPPGGGCIATIVVTVSNPTPISGSPTVCLGATITLSNATTGGTWSSGTTAVATINGGTRVVTGVSAGSSVITYTLPGGCFSTFTVTVGATPPIGGIFTVCQGGTVTLTDATTGGTWSSATTGVATIGSTTGVVTGVAPGTSVITYTTSGGCTATATITVNGTTPITGILTICNGGTTTLSNATTGGTWSSASTGVATIGASSGVVTSVSGGTTAITYTTPAGCTTNTVVTVNPISPIIGASSICLGGTTTLSDATPGGTRSSSNTGVATIVTTTGVLTSVSIGTTVIKYMMPTGCFATYTVSVVATIPISGIPALCVGGTTTLSNSASGGAWVSGNTVVATIGASSGVVTGVAAGSAPIVYTIGSCVSTITVTVNPPPVAITGITTICAGTITHLSDATLGGTWSSSNPSVATINTATGVVSGTTGGTVTITYQLATGCLITIPVTINPLPATITGPANICLGGSTTLNNTSPGGTWSSNNTAIATVDVTSGVVSGIAIGNDSITYTLATGCLITTTVSVGPLPEAPVTVDLVYCQNDGPIAQLTAVGSSLQWYTVAAGGTPLAAAPVPSTLAAGTYTWYVSQSSNGCEGPRAPLKVTVHPKPPKPFIEPLHPSVCQYDTVNYTYSGAFFTGIQYAWTVPANGIITSGATDSAGISVRFDSSNGPNYMILTIGDGYEPCNVTDTVSAIINASSPNATFYMKPDVCVGDSVDIGLTYHPLGLIDYSWNFGMPGTYNVVVANSDHGGPFKVVWPASGIYIVSLTAFSTANCPSRTVIDTLQVHPYPNSQIAPIELLDKRNEICIGDSVLLQPAEYDYQDIYHWSPTHAFSQPDKAKVYGIAERRGYVMLTVRDPFGCTATDSVLIDAQSCCVVTFPNAFTPNGDGLNDVFRPITIGNHKVHGLRIDNRYGQTVYESVDEKAAWDGNFNGVPQDLGVYFYYFKYDCEGKTIIETGDVTLVR